MRRIGGIAVAAAAAALTFAAAAGTAARPMQVFLLAGQSNMLGEGTPLSIGYGSQPNLFAWRSKGRKGGSWVAASDPIRSITGDSVLIGPGMTFGLDVLSHEPPGTQVGIIQCAAGGTSMADWQPSGSLYQRCRSAALASGGVVAGFLYLQGEEEARKFGGAVWANEFPALEQQVEADFGPVPFVLGQIGLLNPHYVYQQEVRDAQAAAVEGHPEMILVPSDDLENDGEHFTAASEQTLGTRFGEAWWSLAQARNPVVDDVSPVQVGAPVVITGSGFTTVQSVTFGGAPAAFTIDSDNQITATVPSGAYGGTLIVRTDTGFDSATFEVLPLVDSVAPGQGHAGTTITISGDAFINHPTVTINGVPLKKVKRIGHNEIRAKIPKGATSGPITVTTDVGSATSPDTFVVS
jgi:hypothetical protein